MKVTLATVLAALTVAATVNADKSSVVPGKTPTGQQTYEQGQIPTVIKYALQQLNEIRVANGLTKLCINKALQTAAQGSSDWQAANKQMAHMADGQIKSRYSTAGYDWGGYVENVAVNVIGVDSTSKGTCFGSSPYVKVADDTTSAQYVTNCQWWNSEGHRKNMLTPEVNQVGIAFTKGEWEGYGNSYYWTQDFGISAQPCVSDEVIHTTPVQKVPSVPEVKVVTVQPSQPAVVTVTPAAPKVVYVTKQPVQPQVVIKTVTPEAPKVVYVTKQPEQPKVVYVTQSKPVCPGSPDCPVTTTKSTPAPVVTVTVPVQQTTQVVSIPATTQTVTQTVSIPDSPASTAPVVTVTATQPAYTQTSQVVIVPTSTIDVPESPAESTPVPSATYPVDVPTSPINTVPAAKCHKVTRTITKCKKTVPTTTPAPVVPEVPTATYPVVVVPTTTSAPPADEESKEDDYGSLEVPVAPVTSTPAAPATTTPAYGTTTAVVKSTTSQAPAYGNPVTPVASASSAASTPAATATPTPAYGGKSLVDGNSDSDSLY
ncbi:hypothetical protein GGF31_004642 [Allomyces arbusculus]|nr:hypothetical protein GGF31_004642 [Allomyces arbusculus]